MAKIILKTKYPGKVAGILFEVLDLEAKRLQYSISLAKKRVAIFERKYNISSDKLISDSPNSEL